MFAVIDAQTPIDARSGLQQQLMPSIDDVAIPAAPVVDQQSLALLRSHSSPQKLTCAVARVVHPSHEVPRHQRLT